MAQKIDKLVLQILADNKDAVKKIMQVQNKSQVMSKKTGGFISKMKMAWFGVIAAIGGTVLILKKAIGIAAEFEQAIANVASVSGDSQKALASLARTAALKTVFTAKEAADALYFLASAGLKVNDMAQVLNPTLSLAAAGAMGIAEATNMVVNSLKVYGAKMSSAEKFTDIMAKTVSSANTDMIQLGLALQYAAPSAKVAGIKFEELNAIIATLANRGIKGAKAGVQIRMALARLIKPAGEAKAALSKYNISVEEISKLLPTPIKLFERLHDANLSQADALTILGVRQAGVFAMIKDGIPDLKALQKSIENSGGAAKKMADVQVDTLNGALKLLKSIFQEVVFIATAEVLPALKKLIQNLNKFIATKKGMDAIKRTIKGIGLAFSLILRPLLDFIDIFKIALIPLIKGVQILGSVIDSISQKKIPNLKKIFFDAFESGRKEIDDTIDKIIGRYTELGEKAKSIFDEIKEGTTKTSEVEVEAENQAIEQKKQALTDWNLEKELKRLEELEKEKEAIEMKAELDRMALENHKLRFVELEDAEKQSILNRFEANKQYTVDLKDIMKQAMGKVSADFAGAITDVIFESNKMKKNFGEVMLDMIKNVGKLIVKMLILKGIQAAFRFFGFGFSKGGMVEMQTGGQFRGKAGADKNVVRMTDKEYVINAPTAKKNIDFLNWFNFGKIDMSKFMVLPKYQTGGQVGGVNNTTNDNTRTINIDTLTVPARTPVETLLELQEVADQMGLSLVVRE